MATMNAARLGDGGEQGRKEQNLLYAAPVEEARKDGTRKEGRKKDRDITRKATWLVAAIAAAECKSISVNNVRARGCRGEGACIWERRTGCC